MLIGKYQIQKMHESYFKILINKSFKSYYLTYEYFDGPSLALLDIHRYKISY